MKYFGLKKKLVTLIAVLLIFSAGDVSFAQESNVELARRLFNNGKVKEAYELLNNEIKINPKNTNAYIELAEIYLSNNELSKAKGLLNKAFKLEPSNPKILSLTAELFYRNSQLDQAEQISRKALGINPEDSTAYLVLGKIYIKKAENTKILAPSKVISLRKEGFRNLKMASKYNPVSPDAHIGLAKVYLAEGQHSKVYDELLIAEELGFRNPDIIYFIGETYYQIGKYEKAIKFLTKPQIYNSGKYYNTHFLLANIYEKLGDPVNAKKEYQLTMKYSPNHLESRVRLDQMRENLVNTDNNSFMSSIPVKNTGPKSTENLNTLADYYLVMDKLPQARELYRQVLERDPRDKRARVGLCELYYAQWLLGYFNPKTYYADRLFIEDDSFMPEMVLPMVKAKISVNQTISGEIKDELREISGNTDQEAYSLVNASRAAFLLGNYKLSNKLLHSFVVNQLSDYQKFEAAKGMFLDRNYNEAKILLTSLQQTYPDDIINSILIRIDEKIRLADDLTIQGKELYKKKDYQAAILKYQEAIKEVPTHKTAHIQYAYALKEIGQTDKAIAEIDIYSVLEGIYPSQKPELHWKKVGQLKNSWSGK